MNGRRRWDHRQTLGDQGDGANRQTRRDRARATRQHGAPRGRPRDLLIFTLIGMRNLQKAQLTEKWRQYRGL